jgi:GNAT superfamily N-acetyltransferase
MRAQEFVTELFQPGKDWRWSFQGSEEAVAVFQVGEVPYMFHAYGSDGEWEAEFKQHGSKLSKMQKFGLTGTGNSAEVMSTVVDIMRAFLEKYQDKIQVLTFSAKEDSRQGLYARMIKRLLPDWRMQQKDEFFTLFAPKQATESHEFVQEIERISPGSYSGGKEYLYDKTTGKQIKKLPGGSGLLYSVSEGRYGSIDIKLWDPNGADYVAQKSAQPEPKPVKLRGESTWTFARRLDQWARRQQGLTAPGQLIGKLSVEGDSSFPLRRAVQVGTITVDEDYRGAGIAKALYGIVLTILKRPLLAGTSQTPGGRRNWVSLAGIPGVEMKGWVALDETELDPTVSRYSGTTPAQANKNIDTIMGQLGGQHLGKNSYGTDYFAFDVRPNTTGTELEAAVKTKLSQVYGSNYNSDAGLYAVWTG